MRARLNYLPHQYPYFRRTAVIDNDFTCKLAIRCDRHLPDEIIERAVAAVVGRHEALRSRYRLLADGWHLDVVAFDSGACLSSGAAAGPFTDEMFDAAADALTAGIDITAGRVLRVGVLRGDTTAIVLVAHHLAADTLALEIVAQELAESLTYGWGVGTADPRPVPVSAFDWADRIAEYVASPESRDERQHWQTCPPPAPFALLRDEPAAGAVDATVSETVGADVVDRLRELLPEVGLTPNEALIGSIAAAYHRLYALPDVVIAGVRSGREVYFGGFGPAGTVGWLTYNVPYLITFDGEPADPVRLAPQLRGIPRHGIGNQALESPRSPSSPAPAALVRLREACVVQVNFMAERGVAFGIPGWSMTSLEGVLRRPYDRHIRVMCWETPAGGWLLRWDFSTGYFASEAVRALAGRTAEILAETNGVPWSQV